MIDQACGYAIIDNACNRRFIMMIPTVSQWLDAIPKVATHKPGLVNTGGHYAVETKYPFPNRLIDDVLSRPEHFFDPLVDPCERKDLPRSIENALKSADEVDKTPRRVITDSDKWWHGRHGQHPDFIRELRQSMHAQKQGAYASGAAIDPKNLSEPPREAQDIRSRTVRQLLRLDAIKQGLLDFYRQIGCDSNSDASLLTRSRSALDKLASKFRTELSA